LTFQGTGKTYLSAFDVANVKPQKMLFLVHREQILKQAMESFKDVLGDGIKAGLLSGTTKNYDADYLFSTVQMMSKPDIMQKFGEGYFDYICLDETHRSGAESYQRIINYFKPKFLLGMTATPERTDGFDIYSQFDHNIAYEIRLQQAMQEKMLCPFHYFGITELIIDGIVIDDTTEFKYLVSEQRVDNIIDKIEFYGHSGDRVKGLIFCSRQEEAKELSRLFNERNYHTIALCGNDSQEAREDAISRLEQDEMVGRLDYIITVDIFNEGVDIPAINQVVMLRPTQSAIIFVQQLGRGLRKAINKEYVVIIDFIGNYAKNFLIPIALSGDRTYNKDTIRKYVVEGNRIIPGCSTVNFDAISKERIFDSIDNIKGIKKFIKDSYISLKYKLGRIPTLVEFYENGEVDPSLILENYKSYFSFLLSVEETYKGQQLSENDLITLEYLSKIISRGKRPHELEILKLIISQGKFDTADLKRILEEKYNVISSEKVINAACAVLEGSFISKDLEKDKYSHIDILVERNTGIYERIFTFYERMKQIEFRNQINDLIELGTKKYQDVYSYMSNRRNEFVLYEKYSRRDVCLLLNWGKDLSSTMYGMKRLKDDVAIFVTYNKVGGDSERAYSEGKPDYADEFIRDSNNVFAWDFQIGRGPNSSYVLDVCEPKRKHLFIKKSDNEGTDYYYMGLFDVLEVSGDKKKDNNGRLREISKMKFKLYDSVREDLKDYLQSN